MTYVARLDAALVGPRRARRDLLQEAADHLDDATEALVGAGYPEAEARARAEADFGPVDVVAAGYQTTLAVAASRRTAWLLLAALIGQPFLWDEGIDLIGLAHGSAPGTRTYAVLNETIEVVGGLMLLGAVAAVVAAGIGNRWVHAGRRIARATAALTLVAVVFLPLNAAGLLTASADGPAVWCVVLVLLVLPLLVAAGSARHTLAAAAPTPPRTAGRAQ
ncbi:hypothetical protein KOI35_14895 [Actinoplanes bogorensis]|uniref:Uncharacterized protein n=1 Tax=Paractinoplanes bogorensis TaxID=1610840 RepID=A0ABS5YMV7_9ACTN|nr:permease prefix domain 1-containing protein [Actinoplanes bogorensis]MBU2664787.1 hypothetical protein [Actinoplanes bogorensis]